MKRLIVARHGDYTGRKPQEEKLTPDGKREMQRLGEEIIAKYIQGGSVRLISSHAPRALQSAEILSSIIGAAVEQDTVLHSSWDCIPDVEDVVKLIKGVPVDVVVIVTHMEHASGVPYFFCHTELNMDVEHIEILKGEMVVIDCEAKTVTIFRQAA